MPKKGEKKGKDEAAGKKVKKPQRFSKLRGMKDVLIKEGKYWSLIIKKAEDLAHSYSFNRIDTPVLERLSLYEKSTGKETDIVSKEMYSFVDKSGDRVAIRPEATPGIVRAYIEHGMFNLPQPVKTFWLGPVFRHEKPQAGRWRQHSQFNMDIFGEESPVADAQLILIAYNFFSELQINVQVQINSIGCRECRAEYVKKLVDFYKERGKRSKLCQDCKKRLVKNPLRLLDCKEDACQEIREDAPQIVDYLCNGCRDHFIKVLEYLDDLSIPYNLNPFLVRGLDYYNRTVFEFVSVDKEVINNEQAEKEEGGDGEDNEGESEGESEGVIDNRRQVSLGGGGRYDKLIEMMGGRETCACGFGLGLERTVQKVREKNIPIDDNSKDLIFVAQLGDQARRKAFILFEEMRRAGFNVRQSFTKDGLKPQLEEANRCAAKITLILGQKELLDGTVIVRDMEAGTQEVIDYKKVYPELQRRFRAEDESIVDGEM